MTAVTGKQRGVGLRMAKVFPLNSAGWPVGAVDENLFTGLEFEGGRAYSISVPSSRRIDHDDNDIVQQVDFLPPLEGSTAELRVGIDNQPVNAALMAVEEYEVGEAKLIDWGSSQQGNEPQTGLLLYQQALDSATSTRRWRGYIADRAKCIPKPANYDENKTEFMYEVALSPSAYHLWGTARAAGTEGNTKAAFATGMFEGKPELGFAIGDGSTVAFLFDVATPAVSVDKVEVWVDGVLTSSGITVAVTGVTFAAAPTLGAKIAIKWEW